MNDLAYIRGRVDLILDRVQKIEVKCASHDATATQFQRDIEDLKDRRRRDVAVGVHWAKFNWIPFVELIAATPTAVRVLVAGLTVLLALFGFHHGG